MTRYREILRLDSLGKKAKDISFAVGCDESTVRRALQAANRAGLIWPLPESLGDEAIKQLIYPKRHQKRGSFSQPDYQWVHDELKKKGVTRSLLYEEYCDMCRASKESFCSITTFNQGYSEWAQSRNVTMHIERKPGLVLEVDWAGTKMGVINRDSGEIIDVYIFVACLPFSGKLFAEGFFSMDSECWLTAHINAFDYYGGATKEIVCDNCKTAVIKHVRRENPIINKAYMNLAQHYGCIIMPTRTRSPRDKGNVEAGVGLITRRAIASLRNRKFFTLGELNAALKEKVSEINATQFAKKPGSRTSIFENQEKECLVPLPQNAFQICSWESATVRSDYHVSIRTNHYSVPYEYIRKKVDVRITHDVIEIFYHDMRIASHLRSFGEFEYITNEEHMPDNHVDYLTWNIEGIKKQAKDIGLACERALILIISNQSHEKKSIGQGKSLLSLSRKYGPEILEKACSKVLAINDNLICSIDAIEHVCIAIYQNEGDIEDSGEHAILRGEKYYQKEKR